MTVDQMSIFMILATTMVLFVWNYWRFDVVAGLALLAAVFAGVVSEESAFSGFSHPAVVTVGCVLVISKALQSSGIVEVLLRYLTITRRRLTTQMLANCGLAAFLSAFMNNIGALALMMPVTIRDAQKAKRPASKLLMPLSFASLLGGLVTLIGTPPNIIIATYRNEVLGEPFSMFDFTPVGLAVALGGLAFIVVFGSLLLPVRGRYGADGETDKAQIAPYITEVRIPQGSALASTTIGDLEQLCENDISVVAFIRGGRRRIGPPTGASLYEGDVLIIEGETESLQPLFENPGLVEGGAEVSTTDWLRSPEVRVMEAVVMPNSVIEGLSMRGLKMHEKFSVNLLGLARSGERIRVRLKHVRFRPGDVLLLQGETEALAQLCSNLGCLAIKNRRISLVSRRGSLVVPLLFGLGILAAASGVAPVHIAFAAVVGALILCKRVSLHDAYRSIEWPVIMLLGFLLPVGEALHNTGATELITDGVIGLTTDVPVWFVIALLILISMVLSDIIHNTPTAVLMAPIAFSLATGLKLPADPFLMAVAVGSASPYLTPIGHQSNTLVLGPGGYRFGDYWRFGLPLDIVIVMIAVPMIMWVWM